MKLYLHHYTWWLQRGVNFKIKFIIAIKLFVFNLFCWMKIINKPYFRNRWNTSSANSALIEVERAYQSSSAHRIIFWRSLNWFKSPFFTPSRLNLALQDWHNKFIKNYLFFLRNNPKWKLIFGNRKIPKISNHRHHQIYGKLQKKLVKYYDVLITVH